MKLLSPRARQILFRTVIGLVILVAGFLVVRALTRYGLSEIVSAWGSIGIARFLSAGGFAACSYLTLTGFDYLGLHYAGHPLAYRRAATASFVGLSIGHNIGVAALSSGAVRYRFYSRWGLGTEQVAKVIAFSGATVGLGLATLGGIAILMVPSDAASLSGLGPGAMVAIGCVLLALPALYCTAAAFVRRKLHIRKWSFALPSPRLACAQVAVGAINFAFVAACLHQLMLGLGDFTYAKVAAIYVTSNVSGLISHVPGGLGVLETTANYLLGDTAALPALIAFRLVYFLIPLLIGLTIFAAVELRWRWRGNPAEDAPQQPA